MKLLASLALALCCSVSHASAVWNIDVRNFDVVDPTFSLVGQFTTNDANVITSFSGVLSDPYETNAAVTLAPLGQSVASAPGLTFDYDNLFLGEGDIASAFDDRGVVVRSATSNVNLFSFSLGAASLYAPSRDTTLSVAAFTDVLAGSVTLDHLTSAVPEPMTAVLLLVGLLALKVRRPAGAGRSATA